MSRIALLFGLMGGLLLSHKLVGQNGKTIRGMILNEQDQPLSSCLVYLTADTLAAPLLFANTNTSGKFSLTLDSVQKVWLQVRYMGYEPQKLALEKIDTAFIRIRMQPQQFDIKEVVIQDRKPPIVVRSDTVRFDLKSFRDSSEYSIEDLLKKLPGVQIDETGTISVNGKSLSKVLIEGDDVFGRQYNMGTKNIRAIMVDEVEVIDHFQGNPVLKDVNPSKEMVMNLKFNKRLKTAPGGSLDMGVGAGKELKFTLQANLFALASKNKLLWLTNVGNTGNQFSTSELQAIYNDPDSYDYRTVQPVKNTFLNPISIDNPGGLPNPYVDNSHNTFSTLRAIFALKHQWKLQLNGTLGYKSDQQFTAQKQQYLFDRSTYFLQTARKNQLANVFFQGEANLNHTSKNLKRSFFTYGHWQFSDDHSMQNILQTLQSKVKNYESFNQIKQAEFNFAGLYTQKIGKNSVGQAQFNIFQLRDRETLQSQNESYSKYWGVDSTRTQLIQNLNSPYREANFFLRYIFAVKAFSAELETQQILSTAQFLPQTQLLPYLEATPLVPISFGENTVQRSAFQQVIKIGQNISKQDQVNLRLVAGRQQIRTMQPDSAQLIPYVKLNLNLEHKFKDGGTAFFAYNYAIRSNTVRNYFTSAYLTDPYTVMALVPRFKTEGGQDLLFSYTRRNYTKFQTHHLAMQLGFNQNVWHQNSFFVQSLQVSTPYYTSGNNSFSIKGNFEQFIPKMKLTFKVGGNGMLSKNFYGINNENTPISLKSINFNLDLIRNLGRRLKVDFLNKFGAAQNTIASGGNFTNHLFSWKMDVALLWNFRSWHASAMLNRTYFKNSGQSPVTFLTTSYRLRKTIELKNSKQGNLSFYLHNLQNTKLFNSLQRSDYFLYISSVEAIPAFVVVSFDLPF